MYEVFKKKEAARVKEYCLKKDVTAIKARTIVI